MVHVHVVPVDSDEVVAQRGLVPALRQDSVLREEYTDLKGSIVGSGTTDPVPYSMGKIRWVLATLERLGLPSLPDPGAALARSCVRTGIPSLTALSDCCLN